MERKVAAGPGVGLRLPHLAEVAATAPCVAWLEVHPENFVVSPHARELLLEVARRYPISVHTVGVSVGSAHGIDRPHLDRVRRLVDDVEAVLVSGHLAWSTHPGEYLNDLLPLPYTHEVLDLVCAQVDAVQAVLGRQYLVENPASYIGFAGSTMHEPEFLVEMVRRTGCGLLCDVSNVRLSAHNMGFDAYAYLDQLPAGAVGELHLGGFVAEAEGDGPQAPTVLVDTHGCRIDDSTWRLYEYALQRFGPRPTLIEWDNDLPAFATLLEEASAAGTRLDGYARGIHAEAV